MTDATDDPQRERVAEYLDRLERGFHRKWDNDPDFREGLEGKDRDILLEFTDVGSWTMTVRDGKLESIDEGSLEDADVRLTAQSQDFLDVIDGDLSPLKAYMTNRIDVSAGLRDILLVKSFLG